MPVILLGDLKRKSPSLETLYLGKQASWNPSKPKSHLTSVWMLTNAELPAWAFGERLILFPCPSFAREGACPLIDLSLFGSIMTMMPPSIPCFNFESPFILVFLRSKE